MGSKGDAKWTTSAKNVQDKKKVNVPPAPKNKNLPPKNDNKMLEENFDYHDYHDWDFDNMDGNDYLRKLQEEEDKKYAKELEQEFKGRRAQQENQLPPEFQNNIPGGIQLGDNTNNRNNGMNPDYGNYGGNSGTNSYQSPYSNFGVNNLTNNLPNQNIDNFGDFNNFG